MIMNVWHNDVDMGDHRYGQGGGGTAPGNVVKCFFCAADAVYSLSRRNIYALF